MAEETKKYAEEVVGPLVEKIRAALMEKRPTEPLKFLGEWAKQKMEEKNSKDNFVTDESESDDDVTEIPAVVLPKKLGPRTSVSAEAYGIWNKKEAFEPKVIPKSPGTEAKIKDLLKRPFMFQDLDPKALGIVVNAMEQRTVKPGEVVIQQKEEGDCLYIVESGNLACTKLFPNEAAPKFLREYNKGDLFGELALLYNAPRAATITAKTESTLWKLDRETFNHIVKEAAIKRRENYESFLFRIKVLQSLDTYERMQLADALRTSRFKAGDFIIKEGEVGDSFYILSEGEAFATKTLKQGEKPQVVMDYKVADYFGELALLKNAPRAANVCAKTECACVWIDRDGFKRLLGPLEEIMVRNIQQYK